MDRVQGTPQFFPNCNLLATIQDADLVETQAALRNSDRHLQGLSDAAQDGMLLIDPVSRKITAANPIMEKLLGHTREEFLGKELWQIGLLESEHASRAAFRKLQQKGFIRYTTPLLESESGQKRKLRVVANLYAELDRNVIQCNIREISSRTQAQAEPRRTGERFRFLAESMPQKIFTAKPNGDVDYLNRQWTEFTGLSLEQIKDWGWLQLIHPEDVEENIRRWKHSLDTGEPIELEHRFRRHDGMYRWHLSRAHCMRDTGGKITQWIGSNTDIDDVKRAEEALRASESRYRRLFEAAHDGILILDTRNRRITDVNQFLLGLLDHPREYFLGKELWEIGVFRDKQENQIAMQELDEKGSIRYENISLPDRNGHLRPVEVVAYIYQEDREPVIQCNIRDIAERVRFAREREVLLANEHSLRMEAEAANRAKDLFLATLSHELRTPLSAIVGWMSILRSEDYSAEDLQEGLEVIDRNTRAQVQLIDDVLDVSRIVSGKLRLDILRCDLAAVVRAALEVVKPATTAKGICIETDLDTSLDRMACDPARMQQVVWNLLSNAVKFTPPGGKIRISLAREGSAARIRVCDTGTGISPDFLPHVFDRFRQADSSARRKYGGIGLGLSIVKQLVELHGGSVEAQSEGEGRGSKFTVHLPIAAVSVDEPGDERGEPSPGSKKVEKPALAPVRLDGLRIVVVDDEADARRLLTKVLGGAGAIVTAVGTVREAVRAVEKVRPQILLSDIAMPDEDGYDLIRQLRTAGHSAQTLPAVALTAYAGQVSAQTALEAGFQTHMSKPADPHNLIAVVESLAGHLPPVGAPLTSSSMAGWTMVESAARQSVAGAVTGPHLRQAGVHHDK